MKKLPVICLLVAVNIVKAQLPVRDDANNSQLQKMVYEEWNNWQPTPKTNWLGLPKNALGWFYWRVLHAGYYKGEDQRPYRLGGPFMQNYAALSLQKGDDDSITAMTKSMMDTHTSTFLNMSGGSADMAYNLFFKHQYEKIYDSVASALNILKKDFPKAYAQVQNSPKFKDFMEYLEITRDRITTIHSSFVDKGKRMEAYLSILKELEFKAEVINAYFRQHAMLSTLPEQKEIEAATKSTPVYNSDKEIVKDILKKFRF